MDLNLLAALDALLSEGTVLGAARRMGLSPPAMSRTLGRIRDALRDPVLVRAGRRMVPTPRALALRERVHRTLDEAHALLTPEAPLDLPTLARVFTLRANDAMVATLGRELDARVRAAAPLVTLRFVPEGDEDVEPLRSGALDLDLGVQGALGPELQVQTLYHETAVCLVRTGHALARGRLTAARLARAEHVNVSRRGKLRTGLDERLAALGLERRVARVVPGFLAGVWIAAESDAVVTVPSRLADVVVPRLPVRVLRLPPELVGEPSVVAQAWHPRFSADPAHAWLRDCIRRTCAAWRGQSGRPRRAPRGPDGLGQA